MRGGLIAILLASCATSARVDVSSSAGASTAAPQCDERVASIGRTLQSIPDLSPDVLVPEDLDLPRTSAAGVEVRADATMLQIGADGWMLFDGAEVRSVAELEEQAEVNRIRVDMERERGRVVRAYPGVLQVWSDHRVPMSEIHRAIVAVGPERVVVLAIDSSPPDGPACPASLARVCPRIERARASERSEPLGVAWRSAVGRCQPLIEGFDELAMSGPDERDALIRRFIVAGVRECRCAQGMDPAAIEYLAFQTFGGTDPRVRGFELLHGGGLPPGITVGDWIARQVE